MSDVVVKRGAVRISPAFTQPNLYIDCNIEKLLSIHIQNLSVIGFNRKLIFWLQKSKVFAEGKVCSHVAKFSPLPILFSVKMENTK